MGPVTKSFPSMCACMVADKEDDCSCPRRETAPDPPALPFPATRENRAKLKDFIVQHYAGLAFNTCERQTLPLMEESPGLSLYVDPGARPYAVHKPRLVPIH